jgi:hypothetical protein
MDVFINFANQLLNNDRSSQFFIVALALFFLAVSNFYKNVSPKVRGNLTLMASFVFLGFSVFLVLLNYQERNSLNVAEQNNKAFYIKFIPSKVTISDGYFQIEFAKPKQISSGAQECINNTVMLKDDDKRVSNYMSLALEAMSNSQVILASRVSKKCMDGGMYQMENLFLEK